MAGTPKKSPQASLNTINGTRPTQFSPQAVLNISKGNQATTKSYQQILNEALGLSPTQLSPQAALYQLLLTPLGLTPAQTQLSEQQLLNMALDAGLSITQIVGTYVPPSGQAGQPIGLLLGLTYAS